MIQALTLRYVCVHAYMCVGVGGCIPVVKGPSLQDYVWSDERTEMLHGSLIVHQSCHSLEFMAFLFNRCLLS